MSRTHPRNGHTQAVGGPVLVQQVVVEVRMHLEEGCRVWGCGERLENGVFTV